MTGRILAVVLLAAVTGWSEQAAFLNPPGYVGVPDAKRAVTNRALTMVSSMAATPGGRLWAVWYAGYAGGEGPNNYIAVSTSDDDGKTWQEVLVIDPDWTGPVRAFDPEVWMAPDGALYLFWAQAIGHDASIGGVWTLKITNPEQAVPQYEAPRRLTDGVMMCKPIVLSTGEWALPVSTWREMDFSAKIAVSADQGQTWTVRGACNVPKEVRNFDEHMIVERGDGSLWMLVRTKYGIGESVSTDRGKTWPELTPSSIPHPAARFFISRLSSGNLLLVKHGPMNERIGRSHLMAFVSADDGQTWGGGLLLDERAGISYPDGQQAADGTVYITYDYSRTGEREILFAAFREEDAAAGKNAGGSVRLRQLISKGSGGQQKNQTAAVPAANDNRDGAALQKTPAGALDSSSSAAEAFAAGVKLFSDRSYTLPDAPDALKGAVFLRTSLQDPSPVRCTRSGMICFLTPQPSRNRDSQTAQLEAQGFQKVALPEFILFHPSGIRNYCTLYQKHCAEGETIRFGKWAVPLFFPEQP